MTNRDELLTATRQLSDLANAWAEAHGDYWETYYDALGDPKESAGITGRERWAKFCASAEETVLLKRRLQYYAQLELVRSLRSLVTGVADTSAVGPEGGEPR